MQAFRNRRARVAKWLSEQGLEAVMFEDGEGHRSEAIRYLTGQPGDALCVILKNGKSFLIAWDVNMARKYGDADEILSYTDFERTGVNALNRILEKEDVLQGSKVEIPAHTTYPGYIAFAEGLERYDPVCRKDGADRFVDGMRAVKDARELDIYRAVSKITDDVMDEIEKKVRDGSFVTEADCALFIERILRERGCESAGFETLCAGPGRSFGIHCFPAWSAAPFASDGMSILDFGLKYQGYTSDVTMTFTRGNLSEKQETMIRLVETASAKAVAMIKPGVKTRDIALAVQDVFAEKGMVMPHGLGHGIGLEAHEAPAVNARETNEWILEPGMIITIEPGLYDPAEGGVRLEDDYLVTAGGYEKLTNSRIVRL